MRHPVEGAARPTLELVPYRSPAHLRKRIDLESRQALIDVESSSGA